MSARALRAIRAGAVATILVVLPLSACDATDDPGSDPTGDQGGRPSESETDRCVQDSVDQFEEMYGPPTAAERATMRDVCGASAAEITEAIEDAN